MNRLTLVASLFATVACTAGALAADLPARTTPDGVWTLLDQMPVDRAAGMEWIRPMRGQGIALDPVALERKIAQIPMEFTQQATAAPAIMTLPTPDGGFMHFSIVESPVMMPALAAQFPDIRTFVGQGIEDRAATLRMDSTPLGFHAQVLSPTGAWYIDPWSRNDNLNYTSYYKRDYVKANDGWQCLTQPAEVAVGHGDGSDSTRAAISLRTYRLACAADGEYTAFFGGTVALGQAAVVTCINRCTGVYETEMAIRMSLVANNSSIIYTNASTDPYTNSNGSTMLTQNQTTCDSVIGTANYDYGHVVSTGGGGVAQLGVICVAGSKAKGVTGSPSPTGDAFWIDYVVHEMGHQFGANHTFNSSTSNCGGGNRSASHAYEPGSGSTIMAYAGICGADDLQPHSDPYMAFDSLDAINAFSGTFTGSGTGYTCAVKTATGNNSPTVNAGANYTIPISTPFALTAASASDPDGDALTYCWEERDLGASITLAAGDNGSSPIIRTFNPSTSPTRIIPNLTALLNNTTTLGERLPTTSRTMTFRCTVRDNKAAAGTTGSATMTVTSTTSSGPFTVTSPNTAVSWQAGAQTVTWNVANTTAAPVSCANVDIYLSTDGGNTWPTTLATAVPNNGSAVVTIPSVNTSTARIKVQGSGNIFFDVSNVNFTITPVAPPGNFSLTSPSNGASNVSTSPTLSWGTSSGANSYLVEIDTDSGFAAPLFFSQSTASTSLALPANTLNNNTIYYWRVTSSNPGGATTVSTPAVSSFTTVPPSPGPFTLSSPANGATGIGFGPTLTWNASSGAVSYLVEVNTDSTFVASNVFSQSVGGTSVGLPANTLVGSTTYYWRVTASNSFSLTAVGSPNPSSFVTAPPPCPADINGDHVVNTTDLGILLTNFGSSVTPNTGGDCNGDGVVNSLDLGIMLSAFGSNC